MSGRHKARERQVIVSKDGADMLLRGDKEIFRAQLVHRNPCSLCFTGLHNREVPSQTRQLPIALQLPPATRAVVFDNFLKEV